MAKRAYIVKDEINEYDLKDNEVVMDYTVYNEFFGTDYTKSNLNSFIPHEVELKQYRLYDYKNENVLYSYICETF